jgi:hypothetical protein
MPNGGRRFAATVLPALLIASAGVVFTPAMRPAQAATPRKLYVIADSVLLGDSAALKAAFPDWQVTDDGFPAIFTDKAAELVAEHAALVGETAIIATGYNYPYWNPPMFDAWVDQMIATLKQAGAKYLFWVTLREVKPQYISASAWRGIQPYYWYFPEVNQHLRDATVRHPDLKLIDWAAVADRPGITYDAIHLNPTGAALMASLVKDAVDGIGRLEKGHELAIDVAGRPDVPDDAKAAVLNVTTTTGHAQGFVTAYPCGEAPPNTSNTNFVPLATAANLVVSRLGNGKVCITASEDVHVVADLVGYFPAASGFAAVKPMRLVDTRTGPPGTRLTAGGVLTLSVTTTGNGPAGARAAVLNVTAAGADGPGYLTVYPCDVARPDASNVNYLGGDAVPNLTVAPLDSQGRACIATSAAADVVVDLLGWFAGPSTYNAVTPTRLLDTRQATTFPGGPLVGGKARTLHVADPAVTRAAVLNVTAANARAPGFVTVYPCGVATPDASNLNPVPGRATANLVITALDAHGDACFVSDHDVDLVVDQQGTLPAASYAPMVPVRLVDTRAGGPTR